MLVFIHISKTAGTTVSHILRSSYGFRHCQVEPWHGRRGEPPFASDDLRRLRGIYPDLKSIAGHRVEGHVDLRDDAGELRYVTFLRHPLKRLASYFQFKVQERELTERFEEWVVRREWSHNRQTKSIAGVADATEAVRLIRRKNIFVGLAERFDESMVLLKALLGVDDLNISYRRVNVARSSTLAEGLLATERSRQLLVEANQADVDLYEFVKQELYPMYQREYGPTLEADVERYRRTQKNTFNYWNLSLCRLKHYLVYKPLLYAYRRRIGRAEVAQDE